MIFFIFAAFPLHCNVSEISSLFSTQYFFYSWRFNKTSTSVTGENFEIKNAIIEDSGFYTCTARNSVGETKKNLEVSVVTVPLLKEEYKVKKGSRLTVPCLQSNELLESSWNHNDRTFQQNNEAFIDHEGSLLVLNMTEKEEGDYSCKIRLVKGEREERTIRTKVVIMPDIVLTKSKNIVMDEGGNFSLKCDVLPGVDAKRMWYQNGEIVHPSPEAGVDITDYSSTLVVTHSKVSNSGTWTCVATTSWGDRDTIDHTVEIKQSKLSCSDMSPPVIQSITGRLRLIN